jgi:hypothetical protein
MSDHCNYPACHCPFDMGADNLCLKGKPGKQSLSAGKDTGRGPKGRYPSGRCTFPDCRCANDPEHDNRCAISDLPLSPRLLKATNARPFARSALIGALVIVLLPGVILAFRQSDLDNWVARAAADESDPWRDAPLEELDDIDAQLQRLERQIDALEAELDRLEAIARARLIKPVTYTL